MNVLEVTVIKACWSLYVPDYGIVGLAVFAALGAGMVALAGLVWLPRPAVGLIGLAVVAFLLFAPMGSEVEDTTPEILAPGTSSGTEGGSATTVESTDSAPETTGGTATTAPTAN